MYDWDWKPKRFSVLSPWGAYISHIGNELLKENASAAPTLVAEKPKATPEQQETVRVRSQPKEKMTDAQVCCC
ncbi:unnamed protein product [Nippostrongylus brasiliensis]|uniref:Transcription initiation factor TFIID subunit 2 n=1 Tax=Nippostrongylus brasiliensis TaxID=27835 RepID=A0A0N4XIX3_NIPBR|nr:unnamed protein product [Nippostrongylus brasiliensis]